MTTATDREGPGHEPGRWWVPDGNRDWQEGDRPPGNFGKLTIHDVTLREGEQGLGVILTAQEMVRIAEELIFGPDAVTTGASNDIERATELARNMVTKWGLSDRLGPLTYSEDAGEVFLGRSVTQHKQVSDGTAHAIDEEVRRVIETNYARAKEILQKNIDKLHLMAEALMKYETIDEEQIKDIMAGRAPRPPSDWDDTLSNRTPPRPEPEGEPGPIGTPAGQH